MYQHLHLNSNGLLKIINNFEAAVWIIDISNNKAFFSKGFKKVYGRSPEEFYHDPNLWVKTIYHEDSAIAIKREKKKMLGETIIDEYRIVKPDGEIRWIEDRGIPFQFIEGEQNLYIGIIIDITERKKAEEQIKQAAYYDDLTGLPNRRLFNEILYKAISSAKSDKSILAIMFIDLDEFKMVNDTVGHNIGDLLLKQVAIRLSSCVREKDIVARQGGDEFIILVNQASDNEIERIAEQILISLEFPFMLGGKEFYITPSIGISIYPQHGDDSDTLIKNADVAMYEVKYNGKKQFRYFSPDLGNTTNRKITLINDFRRAIEKEEFELYYQPKINISSGLIIGVEVLLRWNHPFFGKILPNEFIPIAEETGLIIPLGEWVIRTACQQHKEWEKLGFAPNNLCINISTRQFADEQLIKYISSILKQLDFNPQYLDLEITESVAMYNMEEAVTKLNKLREIGVKLALDDFGTGYSSLNYLRKFPIDQLKIDRSFIKDLLINNENKVIVKSIISIAQSLNMLVIAEGVETEEQLEFLRTQNCDIAQGYYFSPPVPSNEIEKILKHGLGRIY